MTETGSSSRCYARAVAASVALSAVIAIACAEDIPDPAVPDGAVGNPSGEFANTLIRGRPFGAAVAGNTVAAIEQAAALGYRYVEVDVRITADGRLLPGRHDDLAAFSSCHGSVSESEIADLATCTTTDGEPAPLAPIDDALAHASFAGVYLDLKSTDTEPLSSIEQVREAMLALLDHVDDPSVVVAMPYQRDVAEDLLAAGVRAALKGYPDDPAETLLLLDEAALAGAEMICVNLTSIDDDVTDRAAEYGVWLLPWAHATQVTVDALCARPRPPVGGLISGAYDVVEGLIVDTCP